MIARTVVYRVRADAPSPSGWLRLEVTRLGSRPFTTYADVDRDPVAAAKAAVCEGFVVEYGEIVTARTVPSGPDYYRAVVMARVPDVEIHGMH